MDIAAAEARILLYLLLRELAEEPDAIRILMVEGSQTLIFEAHVATVDIPRIVGRKGRVAEAIRALLINLGAKSGRGRYLLEITNSDHGSSSILPEDDLCLDLEAVAPAARLRELMERILQALCDHPEEARVEIKSGLHVSILLVFVSRADIRRVIGRKGRVADALREMLRSLAMTHDHRYLLEIVEPEGSRQGQGGHHGR